MRFGKTKKHLNLENYSRNITSGLTCRTGKKDKHWQGSEDKQARVRDSSIASGRVERNCRTNRHQFRQMSTQRLSWNRCVVIIVVLAMTSAYLTTETDDLLLSKSVPFSKQSTTHAVGLIVASPSDQVKLDNKNHSDRDSREPARTNDKALPVLKRTDLIYEPERWDNPLIVPEYKLVFFALPKVACTEWKLLFRRMYGLPEWPEDKLPRDLHNPVLNQLMYISNYTLEEAQEMLTSDEWTRAVFVREPKERVLSAFLNKVVKEKSFYIKKCCRSKYFHFDVDVEKKRCKRKKQEGDFAYFLNRTLDCLNPHWDPQVNAIDEKWWNQMDFVGYMHHLADDAARLLKNIYSSKGTSAWNDYGKDGWGSNGTAFMVRNTARHATNAHNKLRKYYTPCTEKFVERNWRAEWEEDVLNFAPFKLFNESQYPSDKDCEI